MDSNHQRHLHPPPVLLRSPRVLRQHHHRSSFPHTHRLSPSLVLLTKTSPFQSSSELWAFPMTSARSWHGSRSLPFVPSSPNPPRPNPIQTNTTSRITQRFYDGDSNPENDVTLGSQGSSSVGEWAFQVIEQQEYTKGDGSPSTLIEFMCVVFLLLLSWSLESGD